LGAKPYLCVSQLMLVTPGTRKSKSGAWKPERARKGIRKEPRQQSTCRHVLRDCARRPRVGMSSTMPWGKLGALPTRRIVFELRRRDTCDVETL